MTRHEIILAEITHNMEISHSGLSTKRCRAQSQTHSHSCLLVAMQTHHPRREVSSPPPDLLPHLTTWQSFLEQRCQKGDHHQRRSPGFTSGQMPERDCWIPASDSNKQSALLSTLKHGPQPSSALLSSFASYPPLFLWIKSIESLCHSSPLFLSFPSQSWA